MYQATAPFHWANEDSDTTRNRIRLERASQKQSSDTHKTPYDRVMRCRERKINERVNVDVLTQNKRPCPQHRSHASHATRPTDPALCVVIASLSVCGSEVAAAVRTSFCHAPPSSPLNHVRQRLQKCSLDSEHHLKYFKRLTVASGRKEGSISMATYVKQHKQAPRACTLFTCSFKRRLYAKQHKQAPRACTLFTCSFKRRLYVKQHKQAPRACTLFTCSFKRRLYAKQHKQAPRACTLFTCSFKRRLYVKQHKQAPRACTQFTCSFKRRLYGFNAARAAVAERLGCSPPTKANRVQFPAGSLPDFRTWKSCRTMPRLGGFSRGSPVSPALAFRRCSINFTFISSRDLDNGASGGFNMATAEPSHPWSSSTFTHPPPLPGGGVTARATVASCMCSNSTTKDPRLASRPTKVHPGCDVTAVDARIQRLGTDAPYTEKKPIIDFISRNSVRGCDNCETTTDVLNYTQLVTKVSREPEELWVHLNVDTAVISPVRIENPELSPLQLIAIANTCVAPAVEEFQETTTECMWLESSIYATRNRPWTLMSPLLFKHINPVMATGVCQLRVLQAIRRSTAQWRGHATRQGSRPALLVNVHRGNTLSKELSQGVVDALSHDNTPTARLPPKLTRTGIDPPVSLPDCRKWDSRRTTPMVGGFSRRISRLPLPIIPTSDEALGVRVSVARIAPSLLDLGRGGPSHS
ncbi:hypothetical protein PR048_024071 [Dryococelus australis]|uniref:Uncharacterized protein n=1 Tax=Dryococelus australis TaxID=614101 RepID=A0ABQ9GVV4_9NEOP|nr:hypothetical protein PR048_024071 [Dryococelus australis]